MIRKKCSKCKITGVPLMRYSKKGRYQYYQCRACNNERQRKWYHASDKNKMSHLLSMTKSYAKRLGFRLVKISK